MTKDDFHYFWINAIKKSAQKVYSNLQYRFGNDLEDKYHAVLKLSDEDEVDVKTSYENIRNRIRSEFFNVGADDENRMDGHKICAAITGALLEVRLISFDLKNENLPEEIFYSNYKIAFYASIYCLYMFVLSDYLSANDVRRYDYLYNQKTFYYPKTNNGHDSYVLGRIKTIAINDICGVDFDVLSYADMLFWIDIYNRSLVDKALLDKSEVSLH